MAEDYLTGRTELMLSIQLVDSRHEPTSLDRELNEWLVYHEKQHVVVAAKADKLSNNELGKQLRLIEEAFAESTVMPYSAQSGKGRDGLWGRIGSMIEKK